MSIISEFLISVGFAADERSANQTEARIKRVEGVARKSDETRTRSASEQAMERARQALKAAGVENASMHQIMAKRKEMEALEAAGAKKREEHERRQAHSRTQAAAGLRTISTLAIGAAVAVQGATMAFSGFATQVAAKLESMAYASERTGSSVKDLKVFSRAVSQLGGTAGGALNDLENFAARLRSNPQGYTAFLKSVGVEARDAKGNIKGAAELYKEFRRNVGASKVYEQQLLHAEEMGISEETWRASDPEKLAAEEAALRAKYSRMGFDPDAAKEDAKGLQHAFRDMWDSISIVGEKAASKIFSDVGDNLKSFTTFVEQHGDQIAEILSKVAQIVLAVSRAFLELATSDRVKGFLDGLLNTFGKVDEVTGKWTADTEKIKDVLEALAVFVATVFVAKITNAFKDVLKEAKPLLALLAPFLKVLGIGGSLGVGVSITSAVGADAAVPNAQKPGVTNHWDDEASGAAGGSGIGGAIKRAWQWGKNAIGMGGKSAPTADLGPVPAGLLDNIARAEGTAERGDYNASLGYGKFLPGGKEQILTDKTLNEILDLGKHMRAQPGNPNSSALGRYQIVGDTLRDAIDKLGLDPKTTKFDEATQDKVAHWIARKQGLGAWEGFKGHPGERAAAAAALQRNDTAGGSQTPPVAAGAKEVAGGVHPLDGRGRQTSEYGMRVHPKTGQPRMHNGIDLAAPAGTDVKAMQAGLVKLGSHGDVTVTNPDGSSQTYRHVVPSVEDGARVAAGAIIAQLKANDPRSTGPHLHLEARDRDGNLTDPKGLLAPRAQSEAAQAAPAASKPTGPSLAEQARGAVDRMNDVMGRLDTTKLRAFGEATQGFDPGKFFVVPPAGTENTTNNSSVRNQTFNGGTTNITQNVMGGADEGAAVFKRHKDRQVADDVRYAASVFA